MKISKNELKYYSSLKIRKFRDAENKFLVEGKRICEDLFKSDFEIEAVFTTEPERLSELANTIAKEVYLLSPKEMQRLCDTQSPQSIAAVAKKKSFSLDKDAELILALEDIQDPGNVGTILRNADWFGANNILISNSTADIYNPKTVRSTMGSLFRLNIVQSNDLASSVKELANAGYSVHCADLHGKNLSGYNFSGNDKHVVILGSEAHGPSQAIKDLSHDAITIPRFGKAESLNVANASAIILYEFRRS